ncbi:MAG TPA: hypothetical protein VH643_13250 [Gemmataceae bacterium]|jgi:hypothetical protein
MCPIPSRQGWFVLCAVLVLAGGTPALHAEESARGQELCRLLYKPVHFPGYNDPKTTFAEVLDQLAKRYNLSFDMNEHALKEADLKEVEKYEIASPKPVPEMHTRLGTGLKKILNRVSPSVTYIIRDDFIEITTVKAIRKEFFADRPHGPFPPLVIDNFDKVPLEAALKELAHSGNIVLDARAAKEGQTTVTADLVNVPLDTAVRMLADMAGLKVVPLDNALYVTSKDNARLLMEEQEKLRLQRKCETKPKKAKPSKKTDKPVPPNAKTEPGKKVS